MEPTQQAVSQESLNGLQSIAQETIYLMGASFVLGSLFTLFLLLVLDFMRRNKTEKGE